MSNRLSTRFFSLTPVAAVLLLPLAASAITTVTAPPPMCGGEAMPVEPPYKMVCALDQGISVDSPQDQGDNIRSALERLTASETGLFFPKGRYPVSGNLLLRTGNVLVGSRVGPTNFVNPAPTSSQISETTHSAKNILVDRLVLDNITVQTFHRQSSTVIRGNTFQNTRTPDAQIRVSGASVVTGNVLLREPENPGIGLQLFGTRNAQVEGNWIGEDRSRRDARLAAVRPAASDAHFTRALLSDGSLSDVQIRGNHVVLSVERTPADPLSAPADPHYLALLPDVDRLTLDGNFFGVINGTDDTQQPSVTLRAPQDSIIVGNTFAAVPLHLTSDERETPRPTKRTSVIANLFVEATVDTTQATTQWDESGTTPDDLVFTSNRFAGGEPDCMLSAPIPPVAAMTYGEADNLMQGTGEHAKACNLRHLSIEEAHTRVPEWARQVSPPAIRGNVALQLLTSIASSFLNTAMAPRAPQPPLNHATAGAASVPRSADGDPPRSPTPPMSPMPSNPALIDPTSLAEPEERSWTTEWFERFYALAASITSMLTSMFGSR